MHRGNMTKLTLGVITVTAFTTLSTQAGLYNLATEGATANVNGALFEQIDPSSTGTGVINPFVQLQGNGNEGAYNTDGSLPSPFKQTSANQWNNDLLLSSVPQVTLGSSSYYQFLLDLNETGTEGNPGALITLNQIQIYQTTQGSQTGGSIDAATGRFLTSGLGVTTPFIGTLAFDLNPTLGQPTENAILLDYGLNAGSGSGDMFMYVPVSNFSPNNGQYVVLYSHFGNPPGASDSAAGFEEWATLTPIPEPTTIIAGCLLLLPFASTMLRRRFSK